MLAVSGLRGDRFGPIDLVVRKGEILGIAGAEGNGQVQFLRALAGVERAAGSRVVQRRRARHAFAARPAPCRCRPAERRPARRGPVPRPQRARERDHAGSRATRPLRRRPPRDANGSAIVGARPAPPGPDGLVGATRAVTLRRQPAEGVADPAVPARRRQGDPRRGADAGRRRRRPVRHLRGAEGARRRRASRPSSSRATRSSCPACATASSSCRAGASSRRSPATSLASGGSSRRSSALAPPRRLPSTTRERLREARLASASPDDRR